MSRHGTCQRIVWTVSAILGGVIGAMIGVLWSDPFRNELGHYTTRPEGFKSWLLQAAVGGVVGAAVTSAAAPLVLGIPHIVLPVLALGAYIVYRKEVDPR